MEDMKQDKGFAVRSEAVGAQISTYRFFCGEVSV